MKYKTGFYAIGDGIEYFFIYYWDGKTLEMVTKTGAKQSMFRHIKDVIKWGERHSHENFYLGE